jgi:hypothetical protein
MDTITYRAWIEKTQIGFLNSIIESYEGIAVVRTLHAPSGIIELWVSPDFEQLVIAIMHDLAQEIGLRYCYKATRRLSSEPGNLVNFEAPPSRVQQFESG